MPINAFLVLVFVAQSPIGRMTPHVLILKNVLILKREIVSLTPNKFLFPPFFFHNLNSSAFFLPVLSRLRRRVCGIVVVDIPLLIRPENGGEREV